MISNRKYFQLQNEWTVNRTKESHKRTVRIELYHKRHFTLQSKAKKGDPTDDDFSWLDE